MGAWRAQNYNFPWGTTVIEAITGYIYTAIGGMIVACASVPMLLFLAVLLHICLPMLQSNLGFQCKQKFMSMWPKQNNAETKSLKNSDSNVSELLVPQMFQYLDILSQLMMKTNVSISEFQMEQKFHFSVICSIWRLKHMPKCFDESVLLYYSWLSQSVHG